MGARDANGIAGRPIPLFLLWLEPMRLENNWGFSRAELGRIQRLLTKNQRELTEPGMTISEVGITVATAERVTITKDALSVDLSDGRTIVAPLDWFPRLLYATPQERANCRLIGKASGIHWPKLDEDITVEGLLAGGRSRENQTSLKKWLEARVPRLPRDSSRFGNNDQPQRGRKRSAARKQTGL
jgi:hypothetical protein